MSGHHREAPQPSASPLPTAAPGRVDPMEIASAIAGWVSGSAMMDLVTAFGGKPPAGSLATMLDELERFSGDVWNFRGGGERSQAERFDYPEPFDTRVRAATHALGLGGHARPTRSRYDHILVLGGGVGTCMARADRAAQLLDEGLTADTVAGLGSLRPLTETELRNSRTYGIPECRTEAEAMEASLRKALPPGPARAVAGNGAEIRGDGWWVRGYPARHCQVQVLAAPSSQPGQRADTSDTFNGWAELVARPDAGQRLLIVTTDLHVPFQHCDAVRVLALRYGCGVETVGLNPAEADPWLRRSFASELLQEVRSAIRSMRALYQAVSGGSTRAASDDGRASTSPPRP